MDLQIWRVLDANGNRAAEGLRVLEDVGRLVREDALRAKILKGLRHELADALRGLDREQRLGARSTEHDVGTQVTHELESQRASVSDLIVAEVNRVGQALRALEEFAKLVDPSVSHAFKQLRYRAYDQLAEIELAWTRHAWLQNMRLCLLIDCQLPIDEFAIYVRGLGEAGVDCLQLRDKQCEGRKLVQYARRAVEVMGPVGAHVIVNDRVDVALASGAAGVHVGQEDMTIEDVRRIAGNRLCVGVSTHDISQARAAVAAGADYIGCGPTFPSSTKSFEQFAGVQFLQQVAAEIQLPWLAIGGVTLANLQQVLAAGGRGVALSAAVHAAADPYAAVCELRERLAMQA